MEMKNPRTVWVESLFDVSEPYLYVLVLPVLIMFALGFRSQAILYALGGAAFLTLFSVA